MAYRKTDEKVEFSGNNEGIIPKLNGIFCDTVLILTSTYLPIAMIITITCTFVSHYVPSTLLNFIHTNSFNLAEVGL